jgi:LPXTG-motif cell wall-anchored protein
MRLSTLVATVAMSGASVALAPAAFAQTSSSGATGYGVAPVPGSIDPVVRSGAAAPAAAAPAATQNTPAKNSLPFTGSDVTTTLTIAAGSVAIGAGLVIASRRRQRAAA